MSVLVTRLPNLSPLATLAMFFVALSAGPSSADAPELPAGRPGQVSEVIGPTATVIGTEHYQAQITLACGGSNCSGAFPRPGNKRRHNITRMSCHVSALSGSTFDYGFVRLYSAGSAVLFQSLPVDHSSPAGRHTLNRAIDMRVGSKQRIRAYLYLSATATDAYCTASGTVDTLQ